MTRQFTFFTFLALLTAWVCLGPGAPEVDVQQVDGDTLAPLPPLRIRPG